MRHFLLMMAAMNLLNAEVVRDSSAAFNLPRSGAALGISGWLWPSSYGARFYLSDYGLYFEFMVSDFRADSRNTYPRTFPGDEMVDRFSQVAEFGVGFFFRSYNEMLYHISLDFEHGNEYVQYYDDFRILTASGDYYVKDGAINEFGVNFGIDIPVNDFSTLGVTYHSFLRQLSVSFNIVPRHWLE